MEGVVKIAARLTQLSSVCAAIVLVGCASEVGNPAQLTQPDRLEVLTAGYSLAYSALAVFRIGTLGSASFQSARKAS